ncbi:DNA-binding transcriptional regulator YhcF, GntR family [Lentzea albidocapillata subsp. violacea]|uniref:DNA-binding transcriptional regulator YhcF, GntR family n=1 Tax=Lentzea albidocapillata subsp. violacea TaxID=128104 RepID=A0A1G9CYN1_9PSEU|nr:GntR family transcriptional regulator [Lentzea albidocapillata]SDK56525.1 DNA-binding transcriptional regulator YhcF, GntR family [Lentzea albidocapillata subsp. violacea]
MTAPRIVVDVENGVPPWRQVRDQLVRLINGGVLPVGSRLPTIRQLAADLGLAAGTVARAYRELETSGVLTTGRRQGTVVAALPSHAPDPLSAAAAEFVAVARSLGASEGEALNAVRAHYLGE